jgi:RNA polymerase sigma factor (sigma-70 family)
VTPDADLVRRCLDGDRVAWADLLGRYGDLVHSLLRRAGLDAAAAADGFQEVSVLLWKGLARLRSADRLLPWIATTTRRVAWRARKRSKARDLRQAAAARTEQDPADSPSDALVALEEEQAVRQALAALGERCRRLLSALYFQVSDGGYDEVAERLGIPRGSIGPTRQRCLEGLRRELVALGLGDEASEGRGVSEGRARASTSARGRSRRKGDPAR